MIDARLDAQLTFLVEVGKLKRIYRQSRLIHAPEERENDAEHSWQLALMVGLFGEYAEAGTDLLRTTRMLLIHDLVEIDAGDTFCYDAEGALDKRERECRAADRIFALLPEDQAADWRALWEEFEAGESAEARFANALDRLHPLMLNIHTGGPAWRANGVRADQVRERAAVIGRAAPRLAAVAEGWIREGIERGMLIDD